MEMIFVSICILNEFINIKRLDLLLILNIKKKMLKSISKILKLPIDKEHYAYVKIKEI